MTNLEIITITLSYFSGFILNLVLFLYFSRRIESQLSQLIKDKVNEAVSTQIEELTKKVLDLRADIVELKGYLHIMNKKPGQSGPIKMISPIEKNKGEQAKALEKRFNELIS